LIQSISGIAAIRPRFLATPSMLLTWTSRLWIDLGRA
jgi:hypothetical protein